MRNVSEQGNSGGSVIDCRVPHAYAAFALGFQWRSYD